MHFNRFTGKYEKCEDNEKKLDYEMNYNSRMKRTSTEKSKITNAIKQIFDVSNNTKEKLLEDLFSMNANDSSEEIITLYNATESFMERVDATKDEQLKIIKRVALLLLLENQNSDSESSYNIAEPAIYSLKTKEFWDSTDVKLSSLLIGHTIDFKSTKAFLEIIIKEARKNKDLDSELTSCINVMRRLVIIKHIELEYSPLEKDTTLEEVTQFFNFCLETANKILDENNFPVFKAISLLREGIFFEDDEKINNSLETLEKLGNEELFTMLRKEIDDIFGNNGQDAI